MLGETLFMIARADFATEHFAGLPEPVVIDNNILSQFCVSERWLGDLDTGMITLGAQAATLHASPTPECGLLSLMRCYDGADRSHILDLFEQASTASSHFCYSTTVTCADGRRQPVFCTGQSTGLEQEHSGSISGVFVFPHFQLEPKGVLHRLWQA